MLNVSDNLIRTRVMLKSHVKHFLIWPSLNTLNSFNKVNLGPLPLDPPLTTKGIADFLYQLFHRAWKINHYNLWYKVEVVSQYNLWIFVCLALITVSEGSRQWQKRKCYDYLRIGHFRAELTFASILKWELTNWRHFSCVCPVIDHEFRHNIGKVAVIYEAIVEWIRRLLWQCYDEIHCQL